MQVGFEHIDRSGPSARAERQQLGGQQPARPAAGQASRTGSRVRDHTFKTKEELVQHGFTDAQAAGVMLGRSCQYAGRDASSLADCAGASSDVQAPTAA